MHNLQKKRTLRHFGVDQKGVYRGKMHELYMSDLKDAIDQQNLISLIGSFGSGKTTLFDFLEQDLTDRINTRYEFVRVQNTHKEKMTIAGITDAIIYDLSKETPKRSMEARTRQLARIGGEKHVKNNKKICVIIENAHRIHANTLMAVKDLMECKYLGRSPLFSVALIGHGNLRNKLAKWEEVLWRTLILDLERSGWMSYNERRKYLKAVYGKAITPEARDRIALRTRVPLEMEFYLNEKMEEAKHAGKDVIDGEVVAATLQQRYQALKKTGESVSYNRISEISGVPKSSVGDTIKGKSDTHRDKVQQAIDELEAELRGDDTDSNSNIQSKAG